MIRLTRLTARLLGALVIFLCLAYVLKEGVPGYPVHSTRDVLGFLGLGIGFVGLIVAWASEGFGGALTVAGYLLYAAVDRKILSVWASWAAPIAGILFILVWWACRRGMDPTPVASPRRTLGITGWVRLAVLGAAFVLLALVAAEAILPAPLMLRRTALPARVTGRWEGRAKVIDAWGPPGELMLILSVNGDGSVAGTVGAATLFDGRIRTNRSCLGKALGLRSELLVRGTLRQAITPSLGLVCPVVTFTADLEGQTLKGTLAGFSCRRKGKAEGTLQTAPMTLRKAGASRR